MAIKDELIGRPCTYYFRWICMVMVGMKTWMMSTARFSLGVDAAGQYRVQWLPKCGGLFNCGRG